MAKQPIPERKKMKTFLVSLLVFVVGFLPAFAGSKEKKVTPLDSVPVYTAPPVADYKSTVSTNLSTWTDEKGGPIMVRTETVETRVA